MSANTTHTHGITDPGHFHTANSNITNDGGTLKFQYQENNTTTQTPATNSNTTGITVNTSASLDHTHSISGTTASSGTSATNANLQPYIVVYMWNRTA
jgi:hypothetical protein